jgi:hypothetical protein
MPPFRFTKRCWVLGPNTGWHSLCCQGLYTGTHLPWCEEAVYPKSTGVQEYIQGYGAVGERTRPRAWEQPPPSLDPSPCVRTGVCVQMQG